MADQDSNKVAVGTLLLVVGSVLVLAIVGGFVPSIPPVLGAVGMLAMAAGALLVGMTGTDDGRPV
jgi:hypothetical protein